MKAGAGPEGAAGVGLDAAGPAPRNRTPRARHGPDAGHPAAGGGAANKPPSRSSPGPPTLTSRPPGPRPDFKAGLRGGAGGYALALAATLLALVGRFALAPVLPPTGFPFLTFFPAVVLAAFLGGLGPGLLASALSIAAAKHFFIPSPGFFAFATAADAIALGFFAAVLLVDCAVIHALTASLDQVRRERTRADAQSEAREALAAELETRVGELRRRERNLEAALADAERSRLELAAGEARFRALAEAVPSLLFETDAEGSNIYVNPRFAEYAGLPADELMGDGWLRVLHPDDRARAAEAWAGAVRSGQPYEIEYRFRRRDGAWRWFLGRGVPARDAGGGIPRWVGTCTDIDDRKRAEAALAESEARLKLFIERAPAAIAMLDAGMRYLAMSRRFLADYFGLTDAAAADLEILRGRSHYELFPDVPERWREVHRRVLAGETLSAEEDPFPRADGRTDWVRWEMAPWRRADGSVGGLLLFSEVVTARVDAEQALARSEAELRLEAERVRLALSAGAIIGTWMWDLRADSLTVDERSAETFGLDPALGRTGLPLERVIAAVHPEDVAGLRAAIAEAIARGGPYSHEYRVKGRDGAYRWIEANGRVEHAPDGTPLRFPGVLLNRERRRALEAERDRAAALMRAFVEAVPGVVYAKDRGGRMLVANAGAAALIGRPPEEFIGKTDAETLGDKAQAEAVMANDRRIMEGGAAEQVEEAVSLPDGTPAVWLSTKAPFRDGAGAIVGLVGVSVDITERKRAEERLLLVVHEMNHRVKNTLATVQSIAAQTLRGADPAIRGALEERLAALASAHDVLTREGWAGADMDEVVAEVLAPHGGRGDGRFRAGGPAVRLKPRAAVALSMGLHELATNALKYGALSGAAAAGGGRRRPGGDPLGGRGGGRRAPVPAGLGGAGRPAGLAPRAARLRDTVGGAQPRAGP